MYYDWNSQIEPALDSIAPVTGGYTAARRGLVTLLGGEKVFVKIGVDEHTQKWVRKEIEVYRILNECGYAYAPKLLAADYKKAALAIEYLDGANFESDWNEDKLHAIVGAQNDLIRHKDAFLESSVDVTPLLKLENKWDSILNSERTSSLQAKLEVYKLKNRLSISWLTEISRLHVNWELQEDTLIHSDTRADNFGYFPKEKTGKLVDWNWACLGDISMDRTGLFVDAYLNGVDPYDFYPEYYDKKMIAFVMSYWIASVLHSDDNPGKRKQKLFFFQARNIDVCIELLGNEAKYNKMGSAK